ncbi:SGNH/GDSL hydrolase family protein [Croceimicrobium sp.]|uniref:SGNH/GDSL hydrolase family protein n=1 Tax=Croceimicrobium sp. TaxID=2828340 RepID=UPI003BABE5B3
MRSIYLLGLVLWACANGSAPDASQPEPRPSYSYLALGDSYTIGTAIGKDSSYAALLVDSLEESNSNTRLNYQVVAKNGWTSQDLLQAMAKADFDPSYDLVSVLIGVNNQYQGRSVEEYKSEFLLIIDQAKELAKNGYASILVISIPDWGQSPAGSGNRSQISTEIDAFNQLQKNLCDSLAIRFIDITELSRKDPNTGPWIANDGLHFSKAMHQLWMRKIYPDWYAILQD